MKYFVTDQERRGTCYHEFWQGQWDGESFWREDSILLHDDVLLECRGFAEAILAVIPNYGPFGITEVFQTQWAEIGCLAEAAGGSVRELYDEANAWAEQVYRLHDRFTILGI